MHRISLKLLEKLNHRFFTGWFDAQDVIKPGNPDFSVVGSQVCIDFVKWFSFLVHGYALILLFESLFWRMPFWFCWFSFLVHECDFFLPKAIILSVGLGFAPYS